MGAVMEVTTGRSRPGVAAALTWAGWIALCCSLASPVIAQAPSPSPAAEGRRVGNGPDALPSLRRVGIVSPGGPDYALSTGMRYGLLGPVVSHDDVHHQLGAFAAASLRATRAIALAVRFDGQYVAHVGGPDDGDSGGITRTRLAARGGWVLNERLRVGAEGALGLPAAQTVAESVNNVTAELRGLLTYLPDNRRLLVASLLGVRLDGSASAIATADHYTASDRAVLGAASGAALLWGLGLTYRHGSLDVLAEWSWDLYVGHNAPTVGQSPMHLTGGTRLWLDPSYHLDLLGAVSPSARPDVTPGQPLQVLPPRYWVGISLGMRFGAKAPPKVAAAPPPEPVAQAPGGIEGTVRGPDGEMIANATVSYATPDGPREVVTDEEGHFALSDLPPGVVELQVQADGWQPFTMTVGVDAGATSTPEVLLERPLPQGQIRGTVKDFRGRPVDARVLIKPLGLRVRTDAEGSFEVDVPPGDYTVEVRARGFNKQRRPARVYDNGVTVVIVDLRKR